jgi:hypothetical protein
MPKPGSSATSSESSGPPKPSKYQKFKVERWHRAQIKGAPYNPRVIDSYARKKLEANLKKVGLLDTLVVNRRTGNLVSGHQRLACLDALEGAADYHLDVAVVELTEKQERQQNIFFNNPGAQGAWDVQALGALLGEGLEIEATGFDKLELEVLFDDTPYAELFAVEKAPAAVQSAVADVVGAVAERNAAKAAVKAAEASAPEEGGRLASAPEAPPPSGTQPATEGAAEPVANAEAERIAGLKARRQQFKDAYNTELDTEFYLIVVCGSREESERLLRAMGRPVNDRYVDGRMLGHKLGIDLSRPEST